MKFRYEEYYAGEQALRWAMGIECDTWSSRTRTQGFEEHLNEILDWCRENFEPDTWRYSRREWSFYFAEDRQRVMFKMFFA